MSKTTSMILPTYMQADALRLTLASLERQTADPNSFELIVIDDCSSDHTPAVLSQFRPPFLTKTILLSENRGRSYTRNRGIQAAEGDLLIFCDGDTIPAPDFIERHQRHQATKDGTMVSGINNNGTVYSLLYPDFDDETLTHLLRASARNPILQARLENLVGPLQTPDDLRQKLPASCVPLLQPEDLHTPVMEALIVWNTEIVNFAKCVAERYGPWLDGFHAPWITCVTRNLSAPRSAFTDGCRFNESFCGWGSEDWEMGFRLFKCGVQFYCADDVWTFHQEHPVSPERLASNMANYERFSEEHRAVEIQLLSATSHPPHWTMEYWGNVVTQYYDLLTFHSGSAEVVRAFRAMAQNFRDHVVTHGASPEATGTWAERSAECGDDRSQRIQLALDFLRLDDLDRQPGEQRWSDFLDAFTYLAHAEITTAGGDQT